MPKKKQTGGNVQQISATSKEHADNVLSALGVAMDEVPKEYKKSVISQLYQRIGKAHYNTRSL